MQFATSESETFTPQIKRKCVGEHQLFYCSVKQYYTIIQGLGDLCGSVAQEKHINSRDSNASPMSESNERVVCVGNVCYIEPQEPSYRKEDWSSPMLYESFNFDLFNLDPSKLKTIVLFIFYRPNDDLTEFNSKLDQLVEYYGDLAELFSINLETSKEDTLQSPIQSSLDIEEYYEELGYLDTPCLVAVMGRDIGHVGSLKDLTDLKQYGDNIKRFPFMQRGFVSPIIGKQLPDISNPDHYVGYACDEPLNKVLVYFWATWCNPCLDTLMKGGQLKRELKELGYTFLPVNVDQRSANFKADIKVVEATMQKYEFDRSVDYLVDLDDQFLSLIKESQFFGLPSCLLAEDGVITFMGMKEDTLAHLKETLPVAETVAVETEQTHPLVNEKFDFGAYGLDKQVFSFHVIALNVTAETRLLQDLQEYYNEKGNCVVYTSGSDIPVIQSLVPNSKYDFKETIVSVFLDRIGYVGPLTEQKVEEFKQTALHMQMMACFRRGFTSSYIGQEFPDLLSDPSIYASGQVVSGDLCLFCWAMYDPTCIPYMREFKPLAGYQTVMVCVDSEGQVPLKQQVTKFIQDHGLLEYAVVADVKDQLRAYVQSSMYFMKPCIILVKENRVEFVGGIDSLHDYLQ
ncbi:hypothetical protein HDV06_004623 [Boothiomyces sp. JEL0866]|nr:hypothetical protein HDV06_004623 [Boothiomyces sp. JEL0866]